MIDLKSSIARLTLLSMGFVGLAVQAAESPYALALRAWRTDLESIVDLSGLEYESAISRIFDRHFGGLDSDATIAELSRSDVETLFQATTERCFTIPDARCQRLQSSLMKRLSEVGGPATDQVVAHHRLLVATRQFEKATALSLEYPEAPVERIPDFVDVTPPGYSGASELSVSRDGRLLTRSPIAASPSDLILVVAHPLCHFSRNASTGIFDDAALRGVFERHAKWITPVDQQIDAETIAAWNRAMPGQAVTIPFRREDWPMVDSWATPTFYFIRGGAVVAKIEGWPEAGRHRELTAAARQSGFRDSAKNGEEPEARPRD